MLLFGLAAAVVVTDNGTAPHGPVSDPAGASCSAPGNRPSSSSVEQILGQFDRSESDARCDEFRQPIRFVSPGVEVLTLSDAERLQE